MGEQSRYERAEQIRQGMLSRPELDRQPVPARRLPITDEVMSLGSDIAWGELWSRPGLSRQVRSVISLAIVAAQGRTEQLRFHVHGALNNGLTPEEIVEILFHVGFYAGFPANAVAQDIATLVFTERGLLVDPDG